jgi:nitrite reductase/ring-hydroxylating ferredoxin subunit
MKQKICNINELTISLCKEFMVNNKTESREAFLIYFNNHCYAYLNSCPHTGITLGWQKEQIFSVDGFYLQCSLHGALFEPASGKCIYGPCLGRFLQPLELTIEDNIVYLIK